MLQQKAMQEQHQPLVMFYPALDICSDHPFIILQGEWVTDDERQAAGMFYDFLSSKSMQQLALSNGFRPTNPEVTITEKRPGNIFLEQPSEVIIKKSLPALVQAPSGQVIDELLNQWLSSYKDAPTANG
jgi:hypothetical protein